jgi:hypothetical protein
MMSSSWRFVRTRVAFAAMLLVSVATVAVAMLPASEAGATACSYTAGSPTGALQSCTITGSVTVTAGTLTLSASPDLYWTFTMNGYNQWETASNSNTSATMPQLKVIDATGSGKGWSISEYMGTFQNTTATGCTTSPYCTLTGVALYFNGAGGTPGTATTGAPPAGATPSTACDTNSTCTNATPATSGCTSTPGSTGTCPSDPVNMNVGSGSSTAQTDLYSAAAGSGEGAICFGTAQGCSTPTDYFNMTLNGNATLGGAPSGSTFTSTINVQVNSGP